MRIFYSIWEWLIDRPARLRAFCERGWNGWAKDDTWNYDLYLSKIISEGLIHLKSYKQGTPPEIYKKYDKKGVSQEVKDAQANDEWEEKLEKIIFAFKLSKELINGDISIEDEKEVNKYINEGMKLFIRYYFNLWN